jgi:ribonuclease HI
MKKTIYTDGSCRDRKGGWAFVILFEMHWSDKVSDTTNNRMELTAVIEALKTLKNEECVIYSDSQWVINCAEGRWKRNKNLDLWEDFEEQRRRQKKVEFVWVKGHSTNEYNNLCDKLAYKELS